MHIYWCYIHCFKRFQIRLIQLGSSMPVQRIKTPTNGNLYFATQVKVARSHLKRCRKDICLLFKYINQACAVVLSSKKFSEQNCRSIPTEKWCLFLFHRSMTRNLRMALTLNEPLSSFGNNILVVYQKKVDNILFRKQEMKLKKLMGLAQFDTTKFTISMCQLPQFIHSLFT